MFQVEGLNRVIGSSCGQTVLGQLSLVVESFVRNQCGDGFVTGADGGLFIAGQSDSRLDIQAGQSTSCHATFGEVRRFNVLE